MKFLIILAHPDRRSLNSALSREIKEYIDLSGESVILHDLYGEGFNPALSMEELNRKFSFDERVQQFSREVAQADHLIFIHPDWWGQMPAILKGWIDRVFRQGVAFEFEGADFQEKVKRGLLSSKKATVIITTHREPEKMGIEEIWKKDILGYCGIVDSEILIHFSARTADSLSVNGFKDTIIKRLKTSINTKIPA